VCRYVVYPESLRAMMPLCFKRNFGNAVACIIDYFEVRMERPSTNRAKSKSFNIFRL